MIELRWCAHLSSKRAPSSADLRFTAARGLASMAVLKRDLPGRGLMMPPSAGAWGSACAGFSL